eukprot:TRINITY_DN53511_c0_g1_i1.p1 TRINITY_DN53511_c0_g1~~TRINITY_DN53511_c0_g1_i1.p1  ORF type:complete len:333 (+),score=26.83 TRINITY_DN53511_c0_g1_i1:19-1017(+)
MGLLSCLALTVWYAIKTVFALIICPFKLLRRVLMPSRVNPAVNTVVITGCDTGFGNQLAKMLDAKGVNVIAGCLTEKGVKELQSAGSKQLLACQLDVASDDSVAEFATFVEKNSPSGIWGIVNNAGITQDFLMEFIPVSTYQRIMDVNYFGTVRVTKALLGSMKKTGQGGRIVNIASLAARTPPGMLSAYAASKAAVRAFSEAVNQELQPVYNIRCIPICPSFFKTPMVQGGSSGIRSRFEAADPALKEFYGGEAYIQQHCDNFTKTYQNSPDPIGVVNTLDKALFSSRPKKEYTPAAAFYLFVREHATSLWHAVIIPQLIAKHLVPVKKRK